MSRIGSKLSWITPNMAMRNNEYLHNNDDWFDDSTTQIFNFNDKDNDPENPISIFSEHKTNVIRNSIQNNLNEAITSYSNNAGGSFDFRLPELKVEEWDIVSRNVCMLTFLQGLPLGMKYYNNYSLVASTTNKLYVSKDNLYFTSDGDDYYHLIDCEKLNDDCTGFSAFDYQVKRVKDKDTGEYTYYHKHCKNETEAKKACYYCIVSPGYRQTDIAGLSPNRQRAYYTALAREKHMRYITTNYFGSR